MISYKHTYAVILKLKDTLKKSIITIDLITQFLFLLFYVYLLITRKDSALWLSIYITLISISSIFFIFSLSTLSISNKNFKKQIKPIIRRIIKYIKFLIRATIIGINIYYIIKGDTTDLNKMLTILSIVMLITQIIIDIIIILVNKYIDLLVESIKWDYEESPALVKVASVVEDFKDENKHKVTKKIFGFIGKRIFASDSIDDEIQILDNKRYKIKQYEDKYIKK